MSDTFDPSKIDDAFLQFAWLNLGAKDRAHVLANAPKTFWMFGAGASHHYDLNAYGVPVPLASGFFEAFNRLPTSQGFHAHIGPFINFLEHYRGVAPVDVPKWSENIEDFMTSVERKIEEMKAAKGERDFTGDEIGDAFSYSTVFNNMTFIFASVLNEAQNGPPLSLYKTILETCGPNDSFATFNWDTLLDRALLDTGGWNPDTGYGLNFRAVLDGAWKESMEGDTKFPTEWKLLKLHGSTNWLVPYTAVDLRMEYKPIIPSSDAVFLYWHSSLPYATHKNRWNGGYVPTTYCYYPPNIPGEYFTEPQLAPAEPDHIFVKWTPRLLAAFEEKDSRGVPSSPILITPVRQKKYENYKSTIQSLWSQAVEALEGVNRVVIAGFSFPPTDTRASDLIRSLLTIRGSEIELEIINPGARQVATRIGEDCLAKVKDVKLRDMRMEEYAELLSGSMPALMRKAAGDYGEIREWLERIYLMSVRSGYPSAIPLDTRP